MKRREADELQAVVDELLVDFIRKHEQIRMLHDDIGKGFHECAAMERLRDAVELDEVHRPVLALKILQTAPTQ